MWNGKSWLDLYGEYPEDKNYREEYECDGCGELYFLDELHKIGRQYICDDCLRKEDDE